MEKQSVAIAQNEEWTMGKDNGYQKFVFDTKDRKQVFAFDEMYKAEEKEGFDSWNQTRLTVDRKIAIDILNQYNYESILDIGCGKGFFSHLLQKENNHVLGIDISKEAIRKAKISYPTVKFQVYDTKDIEKLGQFFERKFELTVLWEVLSYMTNWKDVIKACGKISNYCFISLYLPNNPIGCIKSFDSLKMEFATYFETIVEILFVHNNRLILFGKNRHWTDIDDFNDS